ncbi:hypothetical protein [Mucilaginibacter psychrotolerans]|uniref:Uncharacterized protein n=1 Tax=Mucilaginibacter psychrotolerans TaxID=1524096 RepID=A0A4Y8SNB2_9SPHI|nr:hypothetical protein [Mucilaginibacter psychrotolerans]TFF40368.1 hypothetical protein E2R66_03725 [Mucilaginibacter psychrotolerans]
MSTVNWTSPTLDAEPQDWTNPAADTVFGLEERNRIVQDIINDFIKVHGCTDAAIGIIGLALPGAGIPGLIISIGMQATVFYPPMVRKIAAVYLAPSDELTKALDEALIETLPLNVIADLASYFGSHFFKEMTKDILREYSLTLLGALIPFVGGAICAGLDYYIAKKMTNRIGRMVALYFQNDCQWIGNQKLTYQYVKKMPDDLNEIRKKSPEARRSLIKNLWPSIRMMRKNNMTEEQIISALASENVPKDLIREALDFCK